MTNMQLTLTDSQGRMVKHWENVSTGQSLSTDEPLDGVYFLQISSEGKQAVKTLVFRK
ncbi:MAG: T9SS type A sorting domain-containing protein [Saprospiraceae bacterium]|nr:T9SS type A sorting domain-containing protein [Saprospiraceae bacterium]